MTSTSPSGRRCRHRRRWTPPLPTAWQDFQPLLLTHYLATAAEPTSGTGAALAGTIYQVRIGIPGRHPWSPLATGQLGCGRPVT